MANSVDPDETAHYDPSHLALHSKSQFAWVLVLVRVNILYRVSVILGQLTLRMLGKNFS